MAVWAPTTTRAGRRIQTDPQYDGTPPRLARVVAPSATVRRAAQASDHTATAGRTQTRRSWRPCAISSVTAERRSRA
ncbi:hypothetical protein ASE01_08065 [Nocardioides sp. Root190]|nr:hypothetical protein ASE01_08065 [Nocardioides sp. Root190]